MIKTYCAVDIGKNGAFAWIDSGNHVGVFPMPKIKSELDYQKISEILNTNSHYVVFEDLGVIFGTSKQTAFSMGEQLGAIEMACITKKIPYSKIHAKVWQKEMFQGIPELKKPSKSGKTMTRDTKAMALIAIKRIYPNLKLTFGERAEKPHDGLIDAVLIATYAKRMNF